MRYQDLTLPSPELNLALDEARLLIAEESSEDEEILRFWELPHYAVIVGAGGSVVHEVNREACEADGVPVLRRASGGGTVVLGPGCLCISLVLRTNRAPGLDLIQPSTRYVLERMLNAIQPLVTGAQIEGTSDLAINGVKFSGSAQQRKRRYFLHHATVLTSFDLDRIERYLKLPEREPGYRQGRAHREFVRNLPLSKPELLVAIANEWQADMLVSGSPMDRVHELIAEKYSRDEWNRRR